MATEIKYTVTEGGAYQTIQAALDALYSSYPNLVTADRYASIEIDGSWTNPAGTNIAPNGSFVTDATRYIKIYTTAAARHSGKWSTTKFRIEASNTAILNNATGFVWLDGLQFKLTASSATSDVYYASHPASSWLRISNCLAYGVASGSQIICGYHSGSDIAHTTYLWNNIFWDFISAGSNGIAIYGNEASPVLYCYSNTVHNSEYGIFNLGTMHAKNNGVVGGTTRYYNGGTFDGTKNSSDNNDALGTNPINGTPTFVDASNANHQLRDFHLQSSDTLWKNAGYDTSGESAPLNFTTDIDGDTRSTWDVGADEYVAAGGGDISRPLTGVSG